MVAVLVGLAAACGDGAPEPTAGTAVTGPASPAGAASAWFAAVGEGRVQEASLLVADDQLAVLVAIENALDDAELASLLAAGVPETAQQEYWRSFAESFADFAGAPFDALEVGEVTEYAVDGRRFASVSVGLAPGAGSTTFVTTEIDGSWRVDLLATLAPALVAQLRTLATGLEPGADGDAVRDVLVRQIPSLRAAVEQPDATASDDVLRVLEALVRFLAPPLDS